MDVQDVYKSRQMVPLIRQFGRAAYGVALGHSVDGSDVAPTRWDINPAWVRVRTWVTFHITGLPRWHFPTTSLYLRS